LIQQFISLTLKQHVCHKLCDLLCFTALHNCFLSFIRDHNIWTYWRSDLRDTGTRKSLPVFVIQHAQVNNGRTVLCGWQVTYLLFWNFSQPNGDNTTSGGSVQIIQRCSPLITSYSICAEPRCFKAFNWNRRKPVWDGLSVETVISCAPALRMYFLWINTVWSVSWKKLNGSNLIALLRQKSELTSKY